MSVSGFLSELLMIGAMLGGWLILSRFILPRLGVPT
jgi:hypothetical protein